MPLKNKILAIVVGVFLGFAVLDYGILRLSIYPSFEAHEKSATMDDVQRVVDTIKAEMEHLDRTCQDWASWDDTYRFAATGDDAYIQSNLQPATFQDNQIDALMILEMSGKLVWGNGFDRNAKTWLDVKTAQETFDLVKHRVIATADGSAGAIATIIPIHRGLMMVAARPIMKSDKSGPSQGWMIFGRLLDTALQQRLAQQALVDFSLSSQPPAPPAEQSPPGSDIIRLTRPLPAASGAPLAWITVKRKSVFIREGQKVLKFSFISMMSAGSILVIVLLGLLQRTVLKPLFSLTAHAMDLSTTADLTKRLGWQRQDEFGVLSRTIDSMVERLREKTAALMAANTSLSADIIERRAIEKSMARSQQMFQTISESARDVIIIIDHDGCILFWSKAGKSVLGYSELDVIGKDLHSLLAPGRFHDAYQAGLKRFKATGGGPAIGRTLKLVALHKDGHELPVELSLSSLEQDNRFQAVGVLRDVSDRERTEKALLESETRYRTLFEKAGDGIFLLEAGGPDAGRIVDANQAAAGMHGYTREEILQLSIHDLDSHEAGQRVADRLQRMRQGEWIKEEISHRHKDGTLFPVEISAGIVDMGGKTYIYAFDRDITERVKADEERRMLAAAVAQSPELICITDQQFAVAYINPAFTAGTGISPGAATGQSVFELIGIDTRDQEYVKMMGAVRSGNRWSGQISLSPKNGARRIAEALVSPVTHERRRASHWIFLLRDITGEVEKEKQFRQAQKMEAIGTLAGGIAHDFNNILSGIIGYTELANQDAALSERSRQCLQKVLKAGNRATDLVKQILTFSRQGEQELKPLTLSPIIKEALKLLRASLPATIQIFAHIRTDIAVVADATRIHQIIMNLCTNARQSIGEKTGCIEISLEAENFAQTVALRGQFLSPGHYAKLTVQDDGRGIPETLRERIFDPFFTTKKKGEGTGLGLSVVHGIVAGMGGGITLDSQPGAGARFTILLPAIDQPVEEDAAPASELPRGTGRILVVDDEPFQTDMIVQMLEGLGYTVTACNSSSDALSQFSQNADAFDLLITDMTMPELTGDVLALKCLEIRPDIPIALCTGFSEYISEGKAERLGIRAFLMKPVVYRALAETVHRLTARLQ
ncbi:MAG: PAS domain S-box protein [Pseudomonadota bacterium]